MAVTEGSIPVGGTGESLDTTLVTTGEGSVHREGVFVGDPETPAARGNVGSLGGGKYAPFTLAPDPLAAISLGLVPGWSSVLVVGYNPSIDTSAAEDVWEQGGNYVPPTTARIHAIVSSSANDTLAGTGAQIVRVTGLDASYVEVVEFVNMNGTTAVNTVNSYVFIRQLLCVSFGSGGSNAGTITATAATDATVSCSIGVWAGISNLGMFMVPAGKTAMVRSFVASFRNTTAGTLCNLLLRARMFGSNGTVTFGRIFSRVDASPTQPIDLGGWYLVPEKTLIYTRASTTTNNTEVSVYYTVVMRDN